MTVELLNIEPSLFRRGEYIGYGSNTVWRIKAVGEHKKRHWQAKARDMAGVTRSEICTMTLLEMSAAITNAGEAVRGVF